MRRTIVPEEWRKIQDEFAIPRAVESRLELEFGRFDSQNHPESVPGTV